MKMFFCSIVMNLILICVSSYITKVELLEPQPIEECSKLVIIYAFLLLIVHNLATWLFQMSLQSSSVQGIISIISGFIILIFVCVPVY